MLLTRHLRLARRDCCSRPSVLSPGGTGVCGWPLDGLASVAAISAHGEIDAFNASNLTDFALGPLRRCRALILELSGLNFCAAAGFATLHTIDRRCTQMVCWAVVPSAPVSRLLQLCDPHGALPTAASVDGAMQWAMVPRVHRKRRNLTIFSSPGPGAVSRDTRCSR